MIDRRWQVMVVMSHVGIEPQLLKRHLGAKETEQAVKVIKKKHGNRQVGWLSLLLLLSLLFLAFACFASIKCQWSRKCWSHAWEGPKEHVVSRLNGIEWNRMEWNGRQREP